jgi:hypothetical protein
MAIAFSQVVCFIEMVVALNHEKHLTAAPFRNCAGQPTPAL